MVGGSADSRFIAAIGNFDGVHLGHQHLIDETKKIARAENCAPGVLVFDPHPRRYFNPDAPAFFLTSPEKRNALLEMCGVERIFSVAFSKKIADLTPQAFVKTILRDELGLCGVVTGEEFRFGKGRAGDVETLASLCHEYGMTAYQSSLMNKSGEDEKIGSSAVRNALRDGNVRVAAALLGRHWSVSGQIEEGQKLGRTIGFPTANLRLGDIIEPKFGVYAVTVNVAGSVHHGVANFGRRPTVGSSDPLLEVHLIEFSEDIYGASIEISFVEFIRPEQKFDQLDDLKKQIAKDKEVAIDLLRSTSS